MVTQAPPASQRPDTCEIGQARTRELIDQLVLRQLWALDGLTRGQIASRSGLGATRTAGSLRRLEQLGLVHSRVGRLRPGRHTWHLTAATTETIGLAGVAHLTFDTRLRLVLRH